MSAFGEGKILRNLQEIIAFIGEDPDREGLIETPARIIKSWGKLFGGYEQDPKDILARTFSESGNYDEMIISKDIEFYSTCEHHMLPFFGRAHIAYIPKSRVVGISKLSRLLECFSRRLQIQERLTSQIADSIVEHLDPQGVGVLIEAQHLCMVARGVEKQNSIMTTSALKGCFQNPETRMEFLSLCGRRNAQGTF